MKRFYQLQKNADKALNIRLCKFLCYGNDIFVIFYILICKVALYDHTSHNSNVSIKCLSQKMWNLQKI